MVNINKIYHYNWKYNLNPSSSTWLVQGYQTEYVYYYIAQEEKRENHSSIISCDVLHRFKFIQKRRKKEYDLDN